MACSLEMQLLQAGALLDEGPRLDLHLVGAREPRLEAELLQLRSENRDLRLKAGANMTKDDDELIFEEYLLRLGQVQIALALDPPKSSHPHELRLAIDRSSRCATPAGRSRKCSKLTTKPSSSSPTKG